LKKAKVSSEGCERQDALQPQPILIRCAGSQSDGQWAATEGVIASGNPVCSGARTDTDPPQPSNTHVDYQDPDALFSV
jgi:hypothetical protein